MILNVACDCGMIHKIEVGESALCQCWATISLRKDAAGKITPWASGAHGAPHITNKPAGWGEKQIYHTRQS